MCKRCQHWKSVWDYIPVAGIATDVVFHRLCKPMYGLWGRKNGMDYGVLGLETKFLHTNSGNPKMYGLVESMGYVGYGLWEGWLYSIILHRVLHPTRTVMDSKKKKIPGDHARLCSMPNMELNMSQFSGVWRYLHYGLLHHVHQLHGRSVWWWCHKTNIELLVQHFLWKKGIGHVDHEMFILLLWDIARDAVHEYNKGDLIDHSPTWCVVPGIWWYFDNDSVSSAPWDRRQYPQTTVWMLRWGNFLIIAHNKTNLRILG